MSYGIRVRRLKFLHSAWVVMKFFYVIFTTVTIVFGQQFPPVNLPSTCAVVLCEIGNTCKEVLDSSVIQGQCLQNALATGNENVCTSGQPLWVKENGGEAREAFCGLGPAASVCPEGYACNTHPADAYAVCCPNVVNQGQCPAIELGSVGICAFTCSNDGDCTSSQKCCETACGGTSCSNVDSTPENCDTKSCPGRQQCVMRPGPTCVDPPKAGKCPNPPVYRWTYLFRTRCQKDCASDSDCPGYRKCCKDYYGCGKLCEAPEPRPTNRPTCANVRCGQGTECKMQQVQCVTAPCFPSPVCVPKAQNPTCNLNCRAGYACRIQTPNNWLCSWYRCRPRPTCVRQWRG